MLLVLVLGAGTVNSFSASEPAAFSGITEPFWDVILSASVPGIVSAKKIHEGDSIKEGEPILELDKRMEAFEVHRRQLVMDAKKREFDNTRTLYENSKGVSKDELDKAELEYQVAAVEHDMADEQLRKRIITAPFSGTVAEFYLDEGEATQAYQPLAHLVDTKRCYFICNIEAKAAAGLKLNQTVKLEIDTGAAPATVPAKISFLSPVVDPASGLLKIKALFDNTDGKLRPGLAGRMILN